MPGIRRLARSLRAEPLPTAVRGVTFRVAVAILAPNSKKFVQTSEDVRTQTSYVSYQKLLARSKCRCHYLTSELRRLTPDVFKCSYPQSKLTDRSKYLYRVASASSSLTDRTHNC